MIKKSLKSAIGIGIGISLGGSILPRLFFGHLYNDTWPPIWKQALLYLVVGYTVSFLIHLLLNWIQEKK